MSVLYTQASNTGLPHPDIIAQPWSLHDCVRNNPGKESLGLRLHTVYHSGEAILTPAQLLTLEFSWERNFLTMIESHPCPGEDLDVAGASGKGDGELEFQSYSHRLYVSNPGHSMPKVVRYHLGK